MNDLISRQAAIDLLKKWSDGYAYIETETESAIKDFQHLPSAQPKIIHCKDCKHYDGRPCGIVDWYNTADDFCSRAGETVTAEKRSARTDGGNVRAGYISLSTGRNQ